MGMLIYGSPMVINSAKRLIACFDRQYSLAFGIRYWPAFEVRMTICPFVFNNSGTEKLHARRVSEAWLRGLTSI
jgi:hypothetical protein